MELISLAELSALVQVFIVDLVLAGDNAIVVAMAVAAHVCDLALATR